MTQNGWWKEREYRAPGCAGPARESLYDAPDGSVPTELWRTTEELLEKLAGMDFDYVCMGNGSGEEQREVAERVGVDRCLFSEYGWMPWSRNFYISRLGCGDRSEIAAMTEADLDGRRVPRDRLEAMRRSYDRGFGLVPWRRDFVYVPLQVDVDDFKFTLTRFENNPAFLDFIHETVPRDLTVVIKRHPLFKHIKYDIKKYGRFVDITGHPRLNKASLYRRMRAMIVINSTSALEALLFRRKVFAYGRDVFLNKGIVEFGVEDRAEFERRLDRPVREDLCDAFLSLLLERQVDRRRCMADDRDYIDNHYWTRSL